MYTKCFDVYKNIFNVFKNILCSTCWILSAIRSK